MTAAATLSLPAEPTLTQSQKAAIIARVLMDHDALPPLNEFLPRQQKQILREMSGLRHVPRDRLAVLIAEFERELNNIGVTFSGGFASAIQRLEDQLSPDTLEEVRSSELPAEKTDPWDRLNELEPEELAGLIDGESTEVAALTLSKLNVTSAATLLGLLPGPKAREVTLAISRCTAIRPTQLEAIGRLFCTRLDEIPDVVFDSGPAERVGAILNSSASATRDTLLDGLTETDERFAREVRRKIFTFKDIPARLDTRSVPALTRAIDQPTLVVALVGAQQELPEAASFIIDNMSQRMANQIRDEMEEQTGVKPDTAEEAMSAVVAAIRALEASGEIELIPVEE